MIIPGEAVPYNYSINTRFEVVVTSDQLQKGMVVVLASPVARGNPDKISRLSNQQIKRMKETAYWCLIDSPVEKSGGKIHFEGSYANNKRCQCSFGVSWKWIALKESM